MLSKKLCRKIRQNTTHFHRTNRGHMMTIPFVIDNHQHKLADVLNDLLRHHWGHSLDVATASFNVDGRQLLRGFWTGW